MAKPKTAEVISSQFHFTVGRSTLLKELTAAESAAEKKATIPILSNVRLVVSNGVLKLAGTNLDISLETECDVDERQQGGLCLQAKKLLDIIKASPEGEIEFKVGENHQVQIKAGSTKFKMPGLKIEEFPETLALEGALLPMPVGKFRSLITRTSFAITKEESRYTLNGGKLEIGDGKVRMVCTDGHRLALAEFDVDTADQKTDCLIPAKALAQLSSLLAEAREDAPFAVNVGPTQIGFVVGKRRLVSRRLTGEFPNYEMVLPKPKANKYQVYLDVAETRAAIRRVSLMADERSNAVRLNIASDGMTIETPATDKGDASERLTVTYDGPEIQAGFNADYLEDALGAIGEAKARLNIKDGNAQFEFVPREGTGYRSIVMPMRL